MTVIDDPPAPEEQAPDVPRQVTEEPTKGDIRYRRLARSTGFIAFGLLLLILAYLLLTAFPALQEAGWSFLFSSDWAPGSDPRRIGVAALLFDTVLVAAIALVVAVPLSIAVALFITDIAPRWLRRPATTLVDLLAAIPSLIFGLWGRDWLSRHTYGIAKFLSDHFSFIPFFKADSGLFFQSMFLAGLTIALMVIPICTSVMREVFAQAPPGEKEAALALGATRWGMLRSVVLPFGRGGIVGGSMLGLGRALGETVAASLLLGPPAIFTLQILDDGGMTIAGQIAANFGESGERAQQDLIAAGLALFVLTLLVNMAAAAVVSRSRSGQGVEI